MAQTPALMHSGDGVVDYTPSGAAVIAGQVILIGTIPMIAPVAIADGVKGCLVANGIWKIPQAAEIITAGDAVYWDENGTPVTGTALSGAATGTATANNLMGVAVATSAAADSYVYVMLTAAKRTATIAGSVTANDITGSDATLAIAGLSAAQGGLVSVTGALSTTSGNAGGAASLVGGVGGATGAGGAAVVTGGASGATSGTGGAATIAGGAAGSAAGNAAGGAASVTGGLGKGTGAGGAVAATGGASGSGATGNGGAVSLTGGAAASTNGNGGSLVLTGGALAGTGVAGMIRNESVPAFLKTVTAKTSNATLTIAELLTGILTGTHAVGATQTYTLPTGTLCSAGCGCGDGDGFYWHLINLSAAALDTLTLAAGADHTFVGCTLVESIHITTGGLSGSNSATFFSRKTTANTWVTYRVG